MEIKTESDSSDITEYPHDEKADAGMFAVSDTVFSTFICLCVRCSQFTLLVSCCCCMCYK